MLDFLDLNKANVWFLLFLATQCLNVHTLELQGGFFEVGDLNVENDLPGIQNTSDSTSTPEVDTEDVTWDTTETEVVTDIWNATEPEDAFGTTDFSDTPETTVTTVDPISTTFDISASETTTLPDVTMTTETTTSETTTPPDVTMTTETTTSETGTLPDVTMTTGTTTSETTTLPDVTMTTGTDSTLETTTLSVVTITTETSSTSETTTLPEVTMTTLQETNSSLESTASETSLQSTTASSSSVTTSVTTTAASTTAIQSVPTTSTNISAFCNPGFFGTDCAYTCNCLESAEVCDSLYGICQSGCAAGFYGPGCLAREAGDLSVIVFLAVLLVLVMLVCLAQCLYIMVYKPYRKRMNDDTDMYAAENDAFDLAEVATTNNTRPSRERKGSIAPMTEMSCGVPRVKETDIQVTSDVLGRGRFGEVLKGALKTSKGPVDVAYKNVGDDTTEEVSEAFKGHLEVNSLVEDNENIIKFYGVAIVGGEAFAAFEYASKGNLRNFLRLTEEIMDPRGKLLQFALDVAQGMRHLSRKQIIHRELCCEHVLLTENLTAKVSSIHAPNAAVKNKMSRWMSPEVLLRGDHTPQSDVWSFGVLFWEIMSLGDVPYTEVEASKLVSYLDAGSRLSRPEDCDSDIYGLMRWCWHANPEDRPTFSLLANTIREMMDSGQIRLDLEDSDIEEV